MKYFIKKLVLFSFVPIIFIIIISVAYRFKVEHVTLDHTKSVLILGDSHTQSGLDDGVIENSINISQTSEHFLYTYNVLNLILKNNKQIEKVILGVSFHSFAGPADNYILNKDKTIFMYPRYYPILNLESYKDVGMFPYGAFESTFKNMLVNTFSSSNSNYRFIGKFYNSKLSNVNDSTINNAIQRHYFHEDNKKQLFSAYQFKYLDKIADLCKSMNVKLILINTPVHQKYLDGVPKEFIATYYDNINKLASKVKFNDLHNYTLCEQCYGDGDHLNAKGAQEISGVINEKIKQQ